MARSATTRTSAAGSSLSGGWRRCQQDRHIHRPGCIELRSQRREPLQGRMDPADGRGGLRRAGRPPGWIPPIWPRPRTPGGAGTGRRWGRRRRASGDRRRPFGNAASDSTGLPACLNTQAMRSCLRAVHDARWRSRAETRPLPGPGPSACTGAARHPDPAAPRTTRMPGSNSRRSSTTSTSVRLRGDHPCRPARSSPLGDGCRLGSELRAADSPSGERANGRRGREDGDPPAEQSRPDRSGSIRSIQPGGRAGEERAAEREGQTTPVFQTTPVLRFSPPRLRFSPSGFSTGKNRL